MTALDVRAVLVRICALPSPVVRSSHRADPGGWFCQWCHASWQAHPSISHSPHPSNDCLWVLAHQPPTTEGDVLLNVSPETDRWNKMALGITDADVPSRSRAETPAPEPPRTYCDSRDPNRYVCELEAGHAGPHLALRNDPGHRQRQWTEPASPERATPPLAQFADAIKARLTQIGFKAGGLVHQAVDDSLSALSDTPGDGEKETL